MDHCPECGTSPKVVCKVCGAHIVHSALLRHAVIGRCPVCGTEKKTACPECKRAPEDAASH